MGKDDCVDDDSNDVVDDGATHKGEHTGAAARGGASGGARDLPTMVDGNGEWRTTAARGARASGWRVCFVGTSVMERCYLGFLYFQRL